MEWADLKNPAKYVCAVCLVMLGAFVALAAGAAPAGMLLAGYEPSEQAVLTVRANPEFSPHLVVTWPVLGGVNGVPPATEGRYILRLDWTGETDGKIEVRHEWTGLTFNLAGEGKMRIDVYVATAAAEPNIVGIRDDVFGWVDSDAGCLPLPVNEWATVSFNPNKSELNRVGLDHIAALIFEQIPAAGGTIYLDNLRLGGRAVEFAGYEWLVVDRGCGTAGAGPNYFSDSRNNVWLDRQGYLHLAITPARRGRWYCSEVVANASPGYGRYAFTVRGRSDLLDENTVLGLFTWDTDASQYHHREIDVELSRWSNPQNDNTQYVVQPWGVPGNMYRFDIDYQASTETTTHEFIWQPQRIRFRSYFGDFTACPASQHIIASWCYAGDDIPPAGGENPRINFWLNRGAAPNNGQAAEIAIKSFRHLPVAAARIDIQPETLNLNSKGRWITCVIRLGEDCAGVGIEPGSILLEGQIQADGVRFNSTKRTGLAKFDLARVREILQPGPAKLTVSGTLTNGVIFEGTDTIRVIGDGKKAGKKN